jgi:membrane-associated phospholipid phosphatase
MKKFAIALLFFSVFRSGCNAASFLPDTAHINYGHYFISYCSDACDLLISPVHWDKKEWLTAGSVLAATGIVMSFDSRIQKFSQKNRTGFTDRASRYFLEPFGTEKLYKNYSIAAIGLFYIYGRIKHDNRTEDVALLGAKAYALSSLLVTVTKLVSGRHRPYQSIRNGNADPFWYTGPGIDYLSFVSGHTAATFSLATVLSMEYKKKLAVPVVAYIIATLVGLSRINDNKHWASDVFAGAALGIATGRFVYHRKKFLRVEPDMTSTSRGLKLVIPVN